jgi:hypothetical protein
MPLSTYMRNKIGEVLRGTTFTGIATVYVSLHTADPGLTGASEVTGGSYARQATALAAFSAGHGDNTAIETFAGMPACTVTHIGWWDASTAGNFLVGGTCTPNRTVLANDSVEFPVGDLDLDFT